MTTTLEFDGTLESYFYERVGEACEERGHPLNREVEAYVVHLLASHARRPQVAGRTTPALATQFLAARQSGAVALREVGDRALYIAGVVPRSLERGPVGVGYISGIGEAAYREIYARRSRLEVFARLAEGFKEVVAVLGRMIAAGREDAGEDLLALYERWRRDGDPADGKRLIAAGVLLDAEKSDLVQ